MRRLVPISLLLVACTTQGLSSSSEGRGTWQPTAANANATCAGYCGERSPDRCYCDRACTGWGDCCPDYVPVCTGAPVDMARGPFDMAWGPVDMARRPVDMARAPFDMAQAPVDMAQAPVD